MSQEFINISPSSQYFYTSSYTFPSGSHKLLNFRSIKHLYYSNFNTETGTIETSGSYDNFLESSFSSGSRKLNTDGEGVVYSIPQRLFGTHIEPKTIQLVRQGTTLIDDGEGNIYHNTTHVGNVIYSHGMIIITDANYIFEDIDSLTFKSNLPIYTKTYSVKVADFEFNHTLNPTAQSGSSVLVVDEYGKEVASNHLSASRFVRPSGVYASNVTGSEFQPYITTVGLYNDSNELIAVAKLAQPLPKPADTELTIQVKLDV